MYDKLGEMLNEALESGKIPADDRSCEAHGRSKPSEYQNDQINSHENVEESGHFSFKESQKSTENPNNSDKNTKNRHCETKGRSNSTGEVIKLHKYTYNMQFPPHIQLALSTLDIAHPFRQKDIKKPFEW